MTARSPSTPINADSSARRLPLVTFLLLAFGLTAGWWWAVDGARTSAAQRDGVLAEQTALRISDWVRTRVTLMHSIENLVIAGLVDTNTWSARVSELIEPIGGLQAINWIDPEGVIAAIAPVTSNEAALGQRVIAHPVAGAYVSAAITSHALRASRPIDLYQGGRGFTLYLPVRDSSGQLLGVINGVFRSDRLERECITDLGVSHHVTLTDEDVPVVAHVNDREQADATVSVVIPIAGREWKLTLSTSPSLPDPVAALVLVIGLALIAGLTWLLRLALLRQAEATEAHAERAEMAARLRSADRLDAMGRLAGGVAHDFNNLLTVIQGHADLMRAQLDTAPLDPAELTDSVAAIRDAATRAAAMTSQLLAFARREPVTRGSVEVTSHLAGLTPMLRNLATEGVTLTVDLPDAPVWAACPPSVLDRALVNLVANARDAVGGHGPVTIRAAAAPAHVTIEVGDAGHGMTPETLRRIFEPFFTTRESGSGLGLATVYGLVTQRGGAVDVESTLGVGTRFTITLPRIPPPDTTTEAAREPRHAPAATIRVVLVEDNDAVRTTLVRALSRSGLDVTDFGSGTAVIDAAPDADVLVTDLVLPDVDGIGVARALRERQPGLPVIIISGYADVPGSVDAPLSAGAKFLAKPFQISELVATIHDLVSQREPRHPPAP